MQAVLSNKFKIYTKAESIIGEENVFHKNLVKETFYDQFGKFIETAL